MNQTRLRPGPCLLISKFYFKKVCPGRPQFYSPIFSLIYFTNLTSWLHGEVKSAKQNLLILM